MEKQGYILMHRKFLDWEWFTDINTCHLFTYCLLRANYSDTEWRGDALKRGQFITSQNNLSVDTGLSIQQVKTALKKLEKTKNITKHGTSKNTIITVLNYNIYQFDNQPITSEQPANNQRVTSEQPANNQRVTSEQPASNQQITTDKENKENKENKEYKEKDLVGCESSSDIHISENEKVAISQLEIKEIIEKWNYLECDLTKLISIKSGSKRMSNTSARVKEFGFANFLNAIDNIKKSSFLQGKNKRGWKISYDWMILPNNFIKVLEGNYTDNNQKGDENGSNQKHSSDYGIQTF